MEKDMRVALLLDLYQKALTQRQADAVDLYFNQDLSLAEIGTHMGISRQGVRDFIQRGQAKLWELDGELGLMERYLRQGRELRGAKALLQKLQQKYALEKEAIFQEVYTVLDRWSELESSE